MNPRIATVTLLTAFVAVVSLSVLRPQHEARWSDSRGWTNGVTSEGSSAIIAAGTHMMLDDRSDSVLRWANAVFEEKYYRAAPLMERSDATVVDYFGDAPIFDRKNRNLWENGQAIATAGKGSTWVYDSVHGIASGTGCCEYTNDFLAYAKPPPRRLPARDLSEVRTHRGLHLGMTIAEAAATLGVRSAAIHRTGKAYEQLNFSKPNLRRGAAF